MTEQEKAIEHLYETAQDYLTMLQDIREGKPVTVDIDQIAHSLAVISQACKTFSYLNQAYEL